MDKKTEIETLRACVATLGRNSYCGEWLAEQIPQIESDLRADFYPQMSRAQSVRECEQRKADTEDERAQMLESAKREADKMRADAIKDAQAIRGRAAAALREALREIER